MGEKHTVRTVRTVRGTRVSVVVDAAKTWRLGGGSVDAAIHGAAGPGFRAGCDRPAPRLAADHRLRPLAVPAGPPERAAILAVGTVLDNRPAAGLDRVVFCRVQAESAGLHAAAPPAQSDA